MSASDALAPSTAATRPAETRFADPAARVPLQLGIAVVFTLLIAVLGTSLIGYNHKESKDAALIAVDDLFARIARQ